MRVLSLLSKVIFGGTLSLIALCAVPYGTVEPWWQAAFECGVFTLTALWFIEGAKGDGWFNGGFSGDKGGMWLPLGLLLLLAYMQTLPLSSGGQEVAGGAVNTALSSDVYETQSVILRMLALVLLLALLRRFTSSERRLRSLAYTVLGVGVVSALFGITRQIGQSGGTGGFVLPFLLPQEGYAQFINRNHFAYLAEMGFGLACGLVLQGNATLNYRLIFASIGGVFSIALVLANSRGGVLSLLCQVFFAALLFGNLYSYNRSDERHSERDVSRRNIINTRDRGMADALGHISKSYLIRALLAVVLIFIVAVGIVWVGGNPLADRFETLSSEIKEADVSTPDAPGVLSGWRRPDIWQATWQLIKAKPLLGVGFGGYWTAIPRYHNASGESTPQQAHNDYMELLASGGVVGTALVLWFAFAIARQARRVLSGTTAFRRATCFGALTGLFGVAVHSTVDFGLHITINAAIFVALIVIATADIEEARSVT